ncbi:hypothetical protein NC651_002130 [Populus alba x Populus x berolinensis]|nr:hypothetical protein NC651_002130 [Populus alba x Populus x berolinensis]
MASKGPRSKLDHETRARRQKALEAPREPHRPKTHWDHVLEEMVWLSKDFESERKWKLAQAKKVALRASKGMLDQATRGEKKLKEEEQRLRKVALNISKDVKKFWVKIEKLVLYKHQMVLDEKKKKALDKQLEFLLGQTERYSTMLAENLVDKPSEQYAAQDKPRIAYKKGDDANIPEQVNDEPQLDTTDNDDEYDVQSEDEVEDDEHTIEEDDEHTIEEDEALITAEERQEELEALHNETDIPLEELLNRYTVEKGSRESSENGATPSANGEDHCERKGNNMSAASDMEISCSSVNDSRRCVSYNDLLEIRTNETRNQLSISDDPAKERKQIFDDQSLIVVKLLQKISGEHGEWTKKVVGISSISSPYGITGFCFDRVGLTITRNISREEKINKKWFRFEVKHFSAVTKFICSDLQKGRLV